MSALDLCCIECRGWAAEEYEPRIAGLEAENERLTTGVAMAISAHNDLEKLLEKAEAALSALKARRCEGCERLNKPSWHCPLLPLDPPAAFACSRWSPRIQGKKP